MLCELHVKHRLMFTNLIFFGKLQNMLTKVYESVNVQVL